MVNESEGNASFSLGVPSRGGVAFIGVCKLGPPVLGTLKTIEDLNLSGNDPTYLFVGYDGTLLSNKSNVSLPWHVLNVPIDWLQPLPKFLRIYGGDYGVIRRLVFNFYIGFKNPFYLFQKIKNKFIK